MEEQTHDALNNGKHFFKHACMIWAGGGYSSVVECSPSISEVLAFILSTEKKIPS
jgi:hypothetical protein